MQISIFNLSNNNEYTLIKVNEQNKLDQQNDLPKNENENSSLNNSNKKNKAPHQIVELFLNNKYIGLFEIRPS